MPPQNVVQFWGRVTGQTFVLWRHIHGPDTFTCWTMESPPAHHLCAFPCAMLLHLKLKKCWILTILEPYRRRSLVRMSSRNRSGLCREQEPRVTTSRSEMRTRPAPTLTHRCLGRSLLLPLLVLALPRSSSPAAGTLKFRER